MDAVFTFSSAIRSGPKIKCEPEALSAMVSEIPIFQFSTRESTTSIAMTTAPIAFFKSSKVSAALSRSSFKIKANSPSALGIIKLETSNTPV